MDKATDGKAPHAKTQPMQSTEAIDPLVANPRSGFIAAGGSLLKRRGNQERASSLMEKSNQWNVKTATDGWKKWIDPSVVNPPK